MLEAGFADEVRALAARPAGLSRTARQALGYRELLSHVEDGVALDDAVVPRWCTAPASSLAGSGCGGGETPGCDGSGHPKTPWQYCPRCWETGGRWLMTEDERWLRTTVARQHVG